MADNIFNDYLYSDLLQSDGFVVDYCICTTYSVDMNTLLSIPFMIGSLSDLNEKTIRSPHYVLEAISSSVSKFAVFCNAGCIFVPQNNSKVYSLLEDSVVQVTLKNKGKGFINFHPKVWVIKETNPDNGISQIKIVVMSRNLTTSNDLDVVCGMKGIVQNNLASKARREKHKPLIDFLEWLKSQSSERHISKGIDEICNCIKCIKEFDLGDSQFDDYDFFPMGIDGYDGLVNCFQDNMLSHTSETIVISPFIDEKFLNKLISSSPTSKKTLITRHSSITEEVLKIFNDGVYAVKEVLTDQSEKETIVDIHEKVYFIRNNALGCNHLYLGSTNATMNGFGRNVEFLIRLQFAPYKMSYDKFRKELINDSKECMFDQVFSIPLSEHTIEDCTSELELRKAIAAIQKARVIEAKGDNYSIQLICNKKIANKPVLIYPLNCEVMVQNLADGILFSNMTLPMLTEFYVIQVDDLNRMIKIETSGLPTELRNQAIFRSIINTKGKFINYISFMLAESPEEYILESQTINAELAVGTSTRQEYEISVSLYEDMIRTAYYDPDRISKIRNVIKNVDVDVIPESFDLMFRQFESAIKEIKRMS